MQSNSQTIALFAANLPPLPQSGAIAVMMPNDASVKKSWKSFRVSVDLVERETGLNFLSNVPLRVQQVIESKADNQ